MAGPASAQDGWVSPISMQHFGVSHAPPNIHFFDDFSGQGDESLGIGPAGPVKFGEGDEETASVPLPGSAVLGLTGITLLSMRRRRPGY